jgi:hypothetical protein
MSLELMINEQLVKNPDLNAVYVFSDGSPGQYKNKYNFAWIAYLFHNIEFVHCFGVTSQFKGPHDSVGFNAKQKVLTAEINKEARCRHSYEWYQILKKVTTEYPGPPYDGIFGATRVTTHYAASSPDDPGIGALEAAADEAWLILNRTMKWKSTPCRGAIARDLQLQ